MIPFAHHALISRPPRRHVVARALTMIELMVSVALVSVVILMVAIRLPIFKEGVARWRNYDPWLQPLKKALGPVLDAYPDAPAFDD